MCDGTSRQDILVLCGIQRGCSGSGPHLSGDLRGSRGIVGVTPLIPMHGVVDVSVFR